MNRHIVATSALALALSLVSMAQERKIDASSLPAAVRKTADAETRGATVRSYSVDVEHGKKVYEVETLRDGRSRDIEIAEDGALNEVEAEVAWEQLPQQVRSALLARAGGARIVTVESQTRSGRLVAYEAATVMGKRKGEVRVGPDGGRVGKE